MLIYKLLGIGSFARTNKAKYEIDFSHNSSLAYYSY